MSDRSRSRSRDRSRSASPRRSSKHSSSHRSEDKNNLPAGVEAISSDDYFLKSTEFRLWLKEEKNKYLDQLSGEDSRHYFKKFVKAWNRGKLSRSHYNPVSTTSLPSSSQTSYKWKFASSLDSRQIEHARKTVDAETNLDRNAGPSAPPPPPSRVFGGRVVGPSAPPPSAGFSESDRVMDREERKERERKERKAERKKGEKEEKEERSGGREGRIEKRRETNASNREMRNKSPGGLEIDDATLMGTGGAGDDFAARIAARDRGAAQQQDRRAQQADARRSAVGTSSSALAERNKATMDMFKNLAAAKFGGGA
ncbi:hypothetical protein BDY24DRAFT_372417 [Mrakia frigida]|uniref:uncharacterized protein n=1 Tax=Mrakia frigida TaxID=29902 RepID=UPI003FCBF3A9